MFVKYRVIRQIKISFTIKLSIAFCTQQNDTIIYQTILNWKGISFTYLYSLLGFVKENEYCRKCSLLGTEICEASSSNCVCKNGYFGPTCEQRKFYHSSKFWMIIMHWCKFFNSRKSIILETKFIQN